MGSLVLGGACNSDLPVSQNKGICNIMNPMYHDNLVCFLVSILFLLLAIVVCHAHAQYGH